MYTQVNTIPSSTQIHIAAEMLQLISEPTRLTILWVLLHGEHSVGQLAEEVGSQPAAVSQHLAKLRLAKLVKVRREGNKMFYVTDNIHVKKVIEQVLSHTEHVTDGHMSDDE